MSGTAQKLGSIWRLINEPVAMPAWWVVVVSVSLIVRWFIG